MRESTVFSDAAYRGLFEHAVEGIFQSRPDGTYIRVNPALARMYGYADPEQLMGELRDIAGQLYVDPNRRDAFMALLERGASVSDFESEIRCRDGARRWISENARAVREPGGKLLYYEGFVTDITERRNAQAMQRRLELEVRQAQKMSALGTLAGGIAHDFNTVLTIISGYTELAAGSLEQEAKAKSHLDRVRQVVTRGRQLSERLMAFSRSSTTAREPVEVDHILDEVVRLLRASLPANVQIRQNVGDQKRAVLADPVEIFQILINLCTNGFEAMGEEGGVLELGLDVAHVGGEPRRNELGLEEGEYLHLTVRDDGKGMPEEVAAHLFDWAYTTREQEGGHGIGLAIVNGIVRGLDGAVRVESYEGAGTVFHVYLPVYATIKPSTLLDRIRACVREDAESDSWSSGWRAR